MKRWQTVKAALYLAISVLIFIFNQPLIPYIGILVGSVVFLYAIEEIIVSSVKKIFFTNAYLMADAISQMIIGTVLFFISSDIVKVCLVWGVWSILRESREFAIAVNEIKNKRLGIINVIEAVVVIILAFFLILEPNEKNARIHVFLLATELSIVVLFYFAELLRDKIYKKKVAINNQSEDDTNGLTI